MTVDKNTKFQEEIHFPKRLPHLCKFKSRVKCKAICQIQIQHIRFLKRFEDANKIGIFETI